MADRLTEEELVELEDWAARGFTTSSRHSVLQRVLAEVRASRAEKARLIETWERYGRRDLDREEFEGTIASRYAAGDTIRELADDYSMREDIIARGIRKTLGYLLEQVAALTAERDREREQANQWLADKYDLETRLSALRSTWESMGAFPRQAMIREDHPELYRVLDALTRPAAGATD